MVLACQQCRYSGTISVEGFWVPFWVLLASKRSKDLQTHAVRRNHSCLRIQKDVKSFEADRKNRVAVLSLLRMPISPLRRCQTSTVYQNQQQNQLVMSPICRYGDTFLQKLFHTECRSRRERAPASS